MKTTLQESIRRYASKLFVSSHDVEHKYRDLLTFLGKKYPSKLWEELRRIQPSKDIRGLAKWARSIKPKKLENAKRIAFHLTHPDCNVYGMECCYYSTATFDAPKLLADGKKAGIKGLVGLLECGNIIGIDSDDAPSPEIELADRYVPLVYAALILADWMAADTIWFGGKESEVYLVNFGVEAIPIGTLRDGTFLPVRKFL